LKDPRAVGLADFADTLADAAPAEKDLRRVDPWFGHRDVTTQSIRLIRALTWPAASAAGELRCIAGRHAWNAAPKTADRQAIERAALDAEARAQCGLIRDIFGNPFRQPPRLRPAWLTPDVSGLALAAYEERLMPTRQLDGARFAVLSDALEEAGCSEPEILQHLRAAGPHVRGCWALDLLVGNRNVERGT
jgi:hypothetical protein